MRAFSRQTSYDVLVNSNPESVDFVVTDEGGAEVVRGLTPEAVHLKAYGKGYASRGKYRVRFERADLQPLDLPLKATLSPVYLLNFLSVFGVPGLLFIDPLTGAMYELPAQLVGGMTSLSDLDNLVPGTDSAANASENGTVR